MGGFKNHWEMKLGGPHEEGMEIYKCTECGGETVPNEGWNGEPVIHNCKPGCSCRESDWKPGGSGTLFKKNFDRIFPNSPGVGL